MKDNTTDVLEELKSSVERRKAIITIDYAQVNDVTLYARSSEDQWFIDQIEEIQQRCPKCHGSGRVEWKEHGLIKKMPCDCGAGE